jgi:hypothetical protein
VFFQIAILVVHSLSLLCTNLLYKYFIFSYSFYLCEHRIISHLELFTVSYAFTSTHTSIHTNTYAHMVGYIFGCRIAGPG